MIVEAYQIDYYIIRFSKILIRNKKQSTKELVQLPV